MDIRKIQNQKEPKKKKIFIILGVILAVLIAVFAFIFFSGSESEKNVKNVNIEKIKEVIYVNESNPNEIQLINYIDNKVIQKLDLSKYKGENKPIYKMNDNYDMLYVVVSNKLIAINKDKEGKLKEDILLSDDKLLSINNLYLSNNILLLSSTNENELLRFDVSANQFLETITLKSVPSHATELDGFVYYIVNNELIKHHIKSNSQDNVVGLIDNPTDMKVINDEIYILSPFGSGLDNSLLLRIDKKEMLVQSLIELEAGQSNIITDYYKNDELFITTKNEKDENHIKTFATTKVMGKNSQESTNYYLENAKEINGLILSYNDSSLNINGVELKNISHKIKVDEPYFYTIIQ